MPWKTIGHEWAVGMLARAARHEPAPPVAIVLTAPNPEAVLPTIRSRCQIMPLRTLPLGQVEHALQDVFQAEPEAARLLARLSVGRIGWAICASQDEEVLSQRS